MVTNSLALSTEMKVASASTSSSLLLSLRPFTSTPYILPFLRFATSFKASIMVSHWEPSHLLICRVLLQSYRCPHAPHHHPLILCFLRLFPWWRPTARGPPRRTTYILTNVCEKDGSSSFCLSHHIAAWSRHCAPPHP